jgi:hypothetical protein
MVLDPARALRAGLSAHLNLGPPPPAQQVTALGRIGGLAGREGLVPQVRPSVGLTWGHCARQLKRYRLEIESEWTARDRELKMFGGPARTFFCPG